MNSVSRESQSVMRDAKRQLNCRVTPQRLSRNTRHATCLLLFAFCLPIPAAEVDVSELPPAATGTVDFNRDIKPIFETTCFRCHGPEKPKSHFRLDNRESALKGGDNNTDDIVPGDSAKSKLILYTAQLVPDMEMPPPGRGEPLTPGQVGVLRAWIDQGANWGATNPPAPLAVSITPAFRWTGVSGDAKKFRELEGVKEGWAGGAERFSLTEQLSPDERFSVEGRALAGDENYLVKLALEKDDFGFVRAGFERWRKYYDDTGGFAGLLPTNSFSLNRDLYLDIGRAWIDLGLTLPDWPRIVLGYEYQFKDGDKSTLQWGPVGTRPPTSTDTRYIFPAFKHVDEDTQVIKLDLRHELRGWQLEDSARVEFYKLESSRQDLLGFPRPDAVVRVAESDQHTQGANTFSARKQFTDWLSVSGGYLYSRLEGDAAYRQNTLNGSGAFIGGDQWYAGPITLTRESQVASFGALAGPWSGLTLSVGVQGEWTRQEGMGNENLQIGNPAIPRTLFPEPSAVIGNLDSAGARENVSLRFAQIPFTVLFAEARLRQESLARFDQGQVDGTPFTRNTDADIESGDYRIGFSASPWQRISLEADFKHSAKRTDYANTNSLPDYPGFILWRDIDVNQAEARLVLRATRWLRTSFNYRWAKTDFDSATPAVAEVMIPGGPIEAASQEAHEYSVNAVLTPFRRFYLSSTLSYSDSRVSTALDGANGLVPWQGHVWSVLSSATFAVNTNTDLRATCVYSKSDYGQNNQATGLPVGIDYERHGLQVGVTRRFAGNLVASLGYGFDQYREPTSGGVNDFTAHAVFGTVTIPWP
jgi:hypothetical protein